MKKIKDQRVAPSEKGSAAVLTTAVIAVILVVNVIFYILAITLGLYIAPAQGYKIELSGATDSLFAEAIAEKRKVKITFCHSVYVKVGVIWRNIFRGDMYILIIYLILSI